MTIPDCVKRLMGAGVTYEDAMSLRSIAMALRRWSEYECGVGGGRVERDEGTGRPFWRFPDGSRSGFISDREKGSLRRLGEIMARYPALRAYRQRDPRGPALYVLRPGDVPEGQQADAYYLNGIAVYK